MGKYSRPDWNGQFTENTLCSSGETFEKEEVA
jgi:hypothetical protein